MEQFISLLDETIAQINYPLSHPFPSAETTKKTQCTALTLSIALAHRNDTHKVQTARISGL